jgi:ATP-dependent DNA helicase RecG
LIAQHKKLLSTELDRLLQLIDNKKLRSYVDHLLDVGLITTRGIKKGNEFLVNPKVIANSKVNVKTSLKTIEPYRLMALIEEDLRFHPHSKSVDIQKRIEDIPLKEIRKYLYKMEIEGKISSVGLKKAKVYLLAKKN